MNRFAMTVLTPLFAVACLSTAAIAQPVTPNTLQLGLGGYSPVSYFEKAKPHHGTPAFQGKHQGVTYFFASQRELDKFNANPARFVPAYGGWCAYGMAVEGKFDADPTNYQIIDGKLMVFLKNEQVDTLELWKKEPSAGLTAKANAYWAKLNGRTSRAYSGARNVQGDGIAIAGYSPVSYFTTGKPERGSTDFAVEHDGLTYLLTSAEQVATFKADPGKYVPQYGGWCAFGMSVQDKFPVDPTAFKIENGKLLLFLRNEQIDARQLWIDGNAAENTKKADAHWQKVSG